MHILREQLGETLRYITDVNKKKSNLINQGYIDSMKQDTLIRILALNPRGFGPNSKEKINMLK